MDSKKRFLRDPADIVLLNKILDLESKRGLLSDYRKEIIGVGCFDHQDISYTVHFQQITNPDEVMVIPVTEKEEIFVLREIYDFEDKYVYARCTRCPSVPSLHNTLSLLTVLVFSVFMMYWFVHSTVIQATVFLSVGFWTCGALMILYEQNCKIDRWMSKSLLFWVAITDNLMRWYWFVFWVLSAYYSTNDLITIIMSIVSVLWIIMATRIVPDEIKKLTQSTTAFHKLMGVRVPYGTGFPYGE